MKPSPPIIAVLDDELQMRKALRRLLGSHGYIVEEYAEASVFLRALADHPVSCLLLDLAMPETNGFEVLDALSLRGSGPPVIIITGNDQPDTADLLRLQGISAYLSKPVDEDTLLSAIVRATSENR